MSDDGLRAAVAAGVLASEDSHRALLQATVEVARGIFYAKDLYDAAGVTQTPTTVDELKAADDKLKATGVAPLALGAKDAWPAAHWFYWFAIRECAAKTMEKTGDSKDFSDPCWLKAAQDLEDFAVDAGPVQGKAGARNRLLQHLVVAVVNLDRLADAHRTIGVGIRAFGADRRERLIVG